MKLVISSKNVALTEFCFKLFFLLFFISHKKPGLDFHAGKPLFSVQLFDPFQLKGVRVHHQDGVEAKGYKKYVQQFLGTNCVRVFFFACPIPTSVSERG